MEQTLYAKMLQMEHDHWWFVARRRIIAAVLKRYAPSIGHGAKILDAGCGTGGSLPLLSEWSADVHGMELDARAAAVAAGKSGKSVIVGCLPDQVPYADKTFDLIVLLDVLEHIEEDALTLQTLRSKLKPGGHLLITVPAYRWLWSGHDEINHHKRRYLLPELTAKLRQSGLQTVYSSYFNTLLFPVVAAARLLQSCFGLLRSAASDDLSMPPPLINMQLSKIMSSESHWLQKSSLPFGVSIIALSRREEEE